MNPVEETQISDSGPLEGVGDRLRTARNAQGLSVNDVAQALKITPRQVELLEGSAWSELPGYTFVRGFVRNYARFLRLDADQLLKDLDSAAVPQPPALNLSPGTHVALPNQGQAQRRDFITMLLGAGLVLVALLVFFLFPEDWWSAGPGKLLQRNAGEATQVAAPAPPPPASPAPLAAPPAESGPLFPPGSPGEGAVPAGGAVPVTAGGPEFPATAMPGAASLTPPGTAPGAGAPAGTAPAGAPATWVPATTGAVPAAVPATARPGAVVAEFGVSQLSWIEVQDKTGAILLSENLPAGARRSVTGVPPLAVVVGNADGVKLSVNGKVVDLQSRTRNSVARLTLE
jgi:cytoskeleton protein RodZ